MRSHCQFYLFLTFNYEVVLDLLNNYKNGTGFSYILHSNFSNININITIIQLSRTVLITGTLKIGTLLSTELQTFFNIHQFFLTTFLLFQDLIQDPILHGVAISPYFLQCVIVSHSFIDGF